MTVKVTNVDQLVAACRMWREHPRRLHQSMGEEGLKTEKDSR